MNLTHGSTTVPFVVPISTNIFAGLYTESYVHDSMVKSAFPTQTVGPEALLEIQRLRAEMISMTEHREDAEPKTLRLRSHLKFTGIPNQVIEDYTSKIGLDALGLYAVIKKFADYSTGDCYPKIKTICEITGVSRWTVMRKLDVLVENGLILRESGSREGEPNCYTFVLPQKADLLQGCSTAATGGVADLLHANKEELEPLNENQLTLSPPSSEGLSKKPSKKQKQTNSDPRFKACVEVISNGYKKRNWPFAFGKADGEQLNQFLAKHPNMSVTDFGKWMRNYFDSEGVAPGGPPYKYIPKLFEYWAGPKDRFNKILESRIQRQEEVLEV